MQKQAVVFIAVIAAAILLAVAVITSGLPIYFVLAGFLILVAIVTFFPRWLFLRDYQRSVLFRFGRFIGVKGPGWFFFIPHVDSFELIDLRTQTLDIEPQEVITNDNVMLKIDAMIYYRVVDAYKAIVEVKDFQSAVKKLIHAQIRNVVGKMALDEVITKTEEINQALYHILQDVSQEWGIKTVKVEIESIELPPEIVKALHERRAAEEHKARMQTEAEARQDAIDILDRAASKMSGTTLAYLYLNTLQKISDGKSNKIIFPLELSHLASLLAGKIGGKQEVDYEKTIKDLVASYAEKQARALDDKVPVGEEEEHKIEKKAVEAAGDALDEMQKELDVDLSEVEKLALKKKQRADKAKKDKKQKKL